MNVLSTIFSILSAIVTLYTLLCFIDIIMSWLPGVKFTKFGRIISSICDPYMNFFSKFGWLRFGNIDFSPIISIGLLSLVSSILGGIQSTGRIYLGGILATVIYMIWSIISSLLTIMFLLVLIRWIVLLVNHGNTSFNSGWRQVDTILQRFVYKISGTFIKGPMNYKKALLISWISLLVILLGGNYLIRILVALCGKLPI